MVRLDLCTRWFRVQLVVGRITRTGLCWGLLALCSLVFAPVAGAVGEVEPNDDIITATGPISAAGYTGLLSGPYDDDWYVVQLGGGQQVTLAVDFEGDCYFPNVRALVRERRGIYIASLVAESSETTASFTTVPAGGVYYIELEGRTASGCNYSFELTPASAFAPAPPPLPIVSVSEPDDFSQQAHEVSAGAIYTGTIQTVNDVEQLYFPTLANQTVAVEVAAGGCEGEVEARVIPATTESGDNSKTAYGDTSEWGLATIATNTGGRFGVEVSGGGDEPSDDLGCVWQLLASPPSAIGTAPAAPPPPQPQVDRCRVAKRVLARRRYRLRRLQRTLNFVSDRRRPAVHRQILSQKRRVISAKRAVRRECP
jgi:hypothetical protein